MKRTKHYAKQKRQLSFLSKKLSHLLENGQFYKLARTKRNRLIAKIQKRYAKLSLVVPKWRLQKVVAGAAIFLSAGFGQVQAQDYAPPVTNPFGLATEDGITIPNLVDIDGDGDMDILSVFYSDDINAFRFKENIGTEEVPEFTDQSEINPFGLTPSGNTGVVWEFDLADMDNDGDMDILLGANTNYDQEEASLFYYENIGTATDPAFAASVIDPFGLGKTLDYAFVDVADMDNDGDADVITTEYYGGLKYFENTGTPEAPAFAAPVSDPFNLMAGILPVQEFAFLTFADLDGDGDFDSLGSGYGYNPTTEEYMNVFYYQENTGTPEAPSFAAATTETPLNYTPDSVTDFWIFSDVADMDGDGDLDVMTSVYSIGDEDPFFDWLYFENITEIVDGVSDLSTVVALDIFPNPVVDQVNINATFEQQVDRLTIELYSASGKLLAQRPSQTFTGDLNESFDVQDYPAGLYFIKIQADERFSTLKFAKQ